MREKLEGTVAVLDIDAHHGNGTQEIFYERADVLVGSVHVEMRDARPPDPWLEQSLRRHLEASRREPARRLDRMAAAAGGKVFPLPRPRPRDLPSR